MKSVGDWIVSNRAAIVSILVAGAVLVAVLISALTAVCGGVVSLPTGETCAQCIRSWIGAFSGWFAGAIALWIGLVTLRPVIENSNRENRLESQNARAQLAQIFATSVRIEYGYLDMLIFNRNEDALRSRVSNEDFAKAINDIRDLHRELHNDQSTALEQAALLLELKIPEQYRTELDPLVDECVKLCSSLWLSMNQLSSCFKTADEVAAQAHPNGSDTETAVPSLVFFETLNNQETRDAGERMHRAIDEVNQALRQLRNTAERLRAHHRPS